MKMHIHLLDTSIASTNIGDEIIVNSIKPHLYSNFPNAYFSSSSSHDGLGRHGRKRVKLADIVFLLGTNALSPTWSGYGRGGWPIERKDISLLENKVVLFGVGAQYDSKRINSRQRQLLSRLLSNNYLHSVRDEAAIRIVTDCGARGLNTSCPTLWNFLGGRIFPPIQSDTVCFSLTHYLPNLIDRIFIDILSDLYRKLFFWPQQIEDIKYLKKLVKTEDIRIIPPNLRAYETFLSETKCDVIGSRLHGGIHAMKYGCRSIVIALDNRARGIGNDTDLPVIERKDVPKKLKEMLSSEIVVDFSSLKGVAEKFLNQFGSGNVGKSYT